MNSRRNAVTLVARILFALLVVFGALALLSRARSGPVEAQSTQTAPTKRLLENRVPEHLPIRVKIKREKEKHFRDLDNENWARDLELEVKNTGDKPIYFLFFYLLVPEAKIADSYQSFSIFYGRVALSDLKERPTAEDVPIKPGETVVLKIEETGILGWERAKREGRVPKVIHGTGLIFQDLSFGDGTGFEGTTAAPRPRPGEGPGQGASLQPPDSYGGESERGLSPRPSGNAQNFRNRLDAGMFQPASLVSTDSTSTLDSASTASDLPDPICNCANETCQHGIWRFIDSNATNEHCYQCGTFKDFSATNCLETGGCHFASVINRYCPSTGNYCTVWMVSDCAANPPS